MSGATKSEVMVGENGQGTQSNQFFCRRRYVRLGILVTIVCLLVILGLVIGFSILPHNSISDDNGITDNQTTRDNNSYHSSTAISTTVLSRKVISNIKETETLPQNQSILESSCLNMHRDEFPVITIENGELLVCGGRVLYGGRTPEGPFCEIYSSLNREWRKFPDMNVGRSGLTLTLLSDNRSILAIGSENKYDAYTAEIYDRDMNKWFFVPNIMNIGRMDHTATLMKNGQVLIVGGMAPDAYSVLSSTELYIPSSNTFVMKGNLKTPLYRHTAILLTDGLSVLIIGGSVRATLFTQPQIYKAGVWHYTLHDMIMRRRYCAAVLLFNGNVLIAGGVDSKSNTLSSVEIFQPDTETFSPVERMTCARSDFTLTRLPTGQVLAVGGQNSLDDECLRVTELYDPITNQWQSTRQLNKARYDHKAVLINNSVLILGGETTDNNYEFTCERYDL
ncbi:unnamed protein product [Adineta steineri]|uniref:Uncharacterized protein n=1 Tax=Adineta steineri TaxID=433720 RepID=A0A818HDC0_9BILA|nr:unnamed protein product [Adineta steineri]CAF1245542.1 unnamed protein product [Adineta steineri]CAF3502686.1 unnamed protein product [Adineta steineri]